MALNSALSSIFRDTTFYCFQDLNISFTLDSKMDYVIEPKHDKSRNHKFGHITFLYYYGMVWLGARKVSGAVPVVIGNFRHLCQCVLVPASVLYLPSEVLRYYNHFLFSYMASNSVSVTANGPYYHWLQNNKIQPIKLLKQC